MHLLLIGPVHIAVRLTGGEHIVIQNLAGMDIPRAVIGIIQQDHTGNLFLRMLRSCIEIIIV